MRPIFCKGFFGYFMQGVGLGCMAVILLVVSCTTIINMNME